MRVQQFQIAASATCRPWSPTTTQAWRRWSIRAGTSTSTSTRPARRPADRAGRRDAPPQRLRVGRPRARGPDRRDPRHRRRRRAPLRAPRASATATRSRSAASGSPRSTRRATRPSTSSYALADTTRADEPLLLLSGGSLLVGRGRADGPAGRRERGRRSRARCTARSTRSSCRTRTSWPSTRPTAPARCARPGSPRPPWSTIGYERRHNPLLAPMEVDAFARALLRGQPAFPRYFARMRPMNQAGPRLLGGVVPQPPADLGRGDSRRPSRAAPSSSTPGRPRRACRRAHPGLAVDPARRLVRDVARLGRGPRSPARPRRRRRRRPGRAPAPGAAHRPREIVGHLDGGFERVGGGGPARSSERSDAAVDRAGRRAGRRTRRTPAAHRRPAGRRVRGRPRPGRGPHRRRLAAGRLAELPRDRPIAAICARASGRRSAPRCCGRPASTRVAWVRTASHGWARRPAGRVRRGERATRIAPSARPHTGADPHATDRSARGGRTVPPERYRRVGVGSGSRVRASGVSAREPLGHRLPDDRRASDAARIGLASVPERRSVVFRRLLGAVGRSGPACRDRRPAPHPASRVPPGRIAILEAELAERLDTVLGIAERLAASHDREELFRTIVDETKRALRADVTTIRILHDDRLELAAWAGLPDDVARRPARLPARRGLGRRGPADRPRPAWPDVRERSQPRLRALRRRSSSSPATSSRRSSTTTGSSGR